ncbi:MAG: pantetheine-phosphate adenylyltransferase [Propionibacteriaceae bacterium]|jgi:pantetheine-phosphate adenylyltransferase|nr:pantetheine-phosphate adenylyltransferase [Propionibacteriaceae bacterium]
MPKTEIVRAVCPGSFDPITYGHIDIISRAAALFDEVIVAVGTNTTKNYLLRMDERIQLATAALAELPNVRVVQLEGLLVRFCEQLGAKVIVKGLRFSTDFDYELQQHHMNNSLSDVDTVLLPGGRKWGTISSTMLRECAWNGADVSQFVPPAVNTAILAKVAAVQVGTAS